jgi:hydrogenase-4 component F
MHQYGSSEIAAVRGLAARSPTLAATFGLAVLALLGFPPAAVFASELGIARAGTTAGMGWAVAAGFLLAILAFAPIAARTGRMLLGPAPEPGDSPRTGGPPVAIAGPLLAGLLAVAMLGVTIEPVTALLNAAATIVGSP